MSLKGITGNDDDGDNDDDDDDDDDDDHSQMATSCQNTFTS
jgi:hypothetical protein